MLDFSKAPYTPHLSVSLGSRSSSNKYNHLQNSHCGSFFSHFSWGSLIENRLILDLGSTYVLMSPCQDRGRLCPDQLGTHPPGFATTTPCPIAQTTPFSRFLLWNKVGVLGSLKRSKGCITWNQDTSQCEVLGCVCWRWACAWLFEEGSRQYGLL